MRIAVVDSSPLISFVHLDLASKLSLYFDRVLVPRAVHREVNKKGRFRHRLNKLYQSGFFCRCIAANETNILLLREELDEGEAEALIQAQEKTATFFIGDEMRARKIGRNFGMRCVGTVRLLGRLNRDGLAPEPRTLVRKLRRDLRFRVSEDILEQAIAMAGEPF